MTHSDETTTAALTDACANAAAHADQMAAWHEAWRWCRDDSRGPACQLSREARAALHAAAWDGDDAAGTAARLEETAREAALSVLVRSDWIAPGAVGEPAAFELLLSTGGPALRLTGDLAACEPEAAWLEVADWGHGWTRYPGPVDRAALLWFAGLFWYGDA